jgi:hypothetical protein
MTVSFSNRAGILADCTVEFILFYITPIAFGTGIDKVVFGS